MSILKLENVVKTYDKHIAVNRVSFEVPKGSIFGLLGPNGAGKTSIIRIITTIIKADEGLVYLDGEKLNSDHPAQIGYMPEERGLYRKMKVGEHLMYLAQLKGFSKKGAKDAIYYWLNKFDISDWWHKKIQELSKGMQQKIQFIATVVHRPKLLILDEPFSGLDPLNTNLIKEEIDKLQQEGTSIIFSTHRMEQVEEFCEYIVLINKGENVLEGSMTDIKNQFKRNQFKIELEGEIPKAILDTPFIIERQNNALLIQVEEERQSNHILRQLINNGVYIHAFNEILPTLNEIFIHQIGGTVNTLN